ncbi:MAG: hypothetical protein JNG88_09360, partial [Phycisphaerales bacterium]|nr:hypothetical protein [Phycisphaerales bacterium]
MSQRDSFEIDKPDHAARLVESGRAAAARVLGVKPSGLRVIQAAEQAARAASDMGDASPDAPRRACRAGCSACCHLAVAILPIEALMVADRL